MKHGTWLALIATLTLVTGLLAPSREDQWKRFEEAESQGLPRQAIEALNAIIPGAIDAQEYPEAVHAIIRRIILETIIASDGIEGRIPRLEAALETAPAAMRPVMETVLAHWYWCYLEENRWRIRQRTETVGLPGSDFRTWDETLLLTQIGIHFDNALAHETMLKALPIATYDTLLERGNVPDSYRPTVFDFLAHEALTFYQAGLGSIRAENVFELDASETPVFADAIEFMRWEPPATDPTSPIYKAVLLFQKLLRFHEDNPDPSAFYDVDLARLRFGYNQARGDDKDARYQAALERFIEATAAHSISSRALAVLAREVDRSGDHVRARELAQRGLDAFPDAVGGAECFNLIRAIERPTLNLRTERVWNPPWPTLDITYQNIETMHFRAIPLSFDSHIRRSGSELGDYEDDEEWEKLLASKPQLQWTATLQGTPDFKERTEQLPVPESLPPGFYLILASLKDSFEDFDNLLEYTTVWVTDLALITHRHNDRPEISGLVLRAASGRPVVGARVQVWRYDDEQDNYEKHRAVHTDRNGRFEFPVALDEDGEPYGDYIIHAWHQGLQVSAQVDEGYWVEPDKTSRIIFFTDRTLYRPGQPIHYKGIAIRSDHSNADYAVISDREITVHFRDQAGKEIDRATHRTNDFGSFHGTFIAPRDRLTGRMHIAVFENDLEGTTDISVEEYKRPRFHVRLDAPSELVKLDTPVAITGGAIGYSGAAIDGAKVNWSVTREVWLPPWCWCLYSIASEVIAEGSTVTGKDGSFSLSFDAVSDRTIPAKDEPMFNFTVDVDVTDAAGETRSSSRLVRVAHATMRATITAGAWLTPSEPVELTIETQSLQGNPTPAAGTLTIHAIEQPNQVFRRRPEYRYFPWDSGFDYDWDSERQDPSDPRFWEFGEVISEQLFESDITGTAQIGVLLPTGLYGAALATMDSFGSPVTARHIFQVIDPQDRRYGIKRPIVIAATSWTVEPGETFRALWGTGYETGQAFVEIESDGKVLQRYWTPPDRTQALITQEVTEAMRGGFTLRITFVRENRAYIEQGHVEVPWSNKHLSVKWGRFRSRLSPGEGETWTATITGPDAESVAAEIVATLYDASLDQFRPHRWSPSALLGGFRMEKFLRRDRFHNVLFAFKPETGLRIDRPKASQWIYRSFPTNIRVNASQSTSDDTDEPYILSAYAVELEAETSTPPPPPDLGAVAARRNLNETAFFFPQLQTDEAGAVTLQFTMPEALTTWRFMGFAHDRNLRSGFLTDTVVTTKDLMVEPNPPRFVREGDTVEFTVRVSNQSEAPQRGRIQLTFADATSRESVDAALGNDATIQEFEIPAKESRAFSWRITVPDGIGFLTYKAVGATDTLSDGEEGYLPVLSRRILVTESLPLPINGKTTKTFELPKLLASGESDTLRHESLTVQMVSQPIWYSVMALPYLIEFPHECSEQIFNRFFANALARHIAQSDPGIRTIFDLWRDTPVLDSPLMQNSDLRSVMIEETPWLRNAQRESEARRNVGLLFDDDRLDQETANTLQQLSERQLGNGLWSWFPGGRPSEFISLYIMSGFGRLRHLGVDINAQPATRAIAELDDWMHKRYQEVANRKNPNEYVPSYTEALYLYGRSFFLKDHPIAGKHQDALNFFLRQSRSDWLKVDSRMSQAHLALALHRFGDTDTATAIMRSIKEYSVNDPELGMFWRESGGGWLWHRAPIETQALMIEAFAEIMDDAQAVEDCKVWLLKQKQKQTQNWRTTKGTADAVYALVLRGENLLGSEDLVTVALAGEPVVPDHVEAGTGFYQQRIAGEDVRPEMGHVTVTKVDDGVSWGSLHWQYLDDVAKITPHEETPLTLKKALFVRENTDRGPVLRAVNGPLAVGDELVVRLELRADRDMEYIHLKDQRGSGTEPVNVLSGYRFKDGLAYYESTRDTASHFFIDHLPQGVYIFEYATRVQLRGTYESGIATIQSMYAPEFNSHSQSITLKVE